jgi:hypothetical protein
VALLAHKQTHSPRRAQTQAVVRRLYGALRCWLDDSKTRGAADRCHRQTPKKTLRLRKSEPRNRGNDLFARPMPPGLSSIGVGSNWSGTPLDPNRRQCLALEPTAEVASLRRNSRRRTAINCSISSSRIVLSCWLVISATVFAITAYQLHCANDSGRAVSWSSVKSRSVQRISTATPAPGFPPFVMRRCAIVQAARPR